MGKCPETSLFRVLQAGGAFPGTGAKNMKKVICIVLALCFIPVLFTGCGKTDAAKAVISLIGQLGDVTPESGEKIEEAESFYANLTDREKKQVNNYKDLEKARAEYDEIIGFNADIAALISLSDGVMPEGMTDLKALAEKGAALKETYDKMDETRKSYVTGDIDKAAAAAEKVQGYYDNAVACAKAYVEGYAEVDKAKADTISSLDCICTFIDGNQQLMFAIGFADGSHIYSKARFGDPAIKSALSARPDFFFVDTPVNDNCDATKNANIVLDIAEILGREPAATSTDA